MNAFAKWRRSDTAQGLALVSPTFIYALLLLAAPIALVVALSFWTQDYLTLIRTPTLDNYREAWGELIYQTLMLRSLKLRKPFWIFMITIPFWTSYLMRIFLWKVILGYNGVVNGSLMGLGIIESPIREIAYSQNAVVITLAHAWVPFAILTPFPPLHARHAPPRNAWGRRGYSDRVHSHHRRLRHAEARRWPQRLDDFERNRSSIQKS